jgi:hypothetical protein
VLIAPQEYLDTTNGSEEFDACLSYEDVIAHLRSRTSDVGDELRRRLDHRCMLLEYAIARYRRGWQPVPDEQMTALWLAYYQRACTILPSLKMKAPGYQAGRWKVGFTSTTACRRSPAAPPVRLCHKLERGRVQLMYRGWSEYLDLARRHLQPSLDEGMYLEPAARSLAITIDVPPLDKARFPDEQQEAVMRACGPRSDYATGTWITRMLSQCSRLPWNE